MVFEFNKTIMKNFCLILLTLLLLTCDLFDSSEGDETDYSYYYPVEVVDYLQAPGFYSNNSGYSINDNSENIMDFPEGSVPDNSSIITLGEAGGYVTVKFEPAISDIEDSYDFIIYSNTFNSSSSGSANIEPGFVEVSADNENWYLLVADDSLDSITATTKTYYESDYGDYWPEDCIEESMTLNTWESTNYSDGVGYCEIVPREENDDDQDNVTFYANTDIRGGGDPFKLEWAVDEYFDSVTLDEISYIRITTGVYTDDSLASSYSASQTEIDSIIRISSEEE